ncbi:MAG: YidB family protein, partial [Candidatus Nanopelagicales bacterium]
MATNDLSAMLNQVLSGAGGSIDTAKLQQSIQPLIDLIQQNGGLQAFIEKLQASGLGDQVQSWLGQGANLAANPQQLAEALNPESLKAAADKAGASAQDMAGELSSVLPGLVDKLSPSGQLPGTANITDALGKIPGGDQLSGLLGPLLGGGSAGAAGAADAGT